MLAHSVADLEGELNATRQALEVAQTAHAELTVAFEHLRLLYVELADVNAKLELALEQSRSVEAAARTASRAVSPARIGDLTARQRQILQLILDGRPNKIIAADLGLSQRTVESHRAAIMRKTGARSLSALIRMALGAGDAERRV